MLFATANKQTNKSKDKKKKKQTWSLHTPVVVLGCGMFHSHGKG